MMMMTATMACCSFKPTAIRWRADRSGGTAGACALRMIH
jgi:hypothetical protein